MDANFLDELSQITGKVAGDIQDSIGDMSLDDIYMLMNLVHAGDTEKVKQLLSPILDKSDAMDTQPAPQAPVAPVAKTESFNTSFKFPKFGMREEALDLLDENNISYSFGIGSTVHIHAKTLEESKLAMSITDKIATKNITKEDKSMDNNRKKFSKDSNKIVIPGSKPKDPAAQALAQGQASGIFRPKATPNKKTTVQKMDRKHKAKGLDEAFSSVSFWTNGNAAFDVVLESFGDSVTYDGKSLNTDSASWTEIQESLTSEGFRSGVDFGLTTMKKTVQEGVLGMTALPGLRRMMELAGMPQPGVDQLGADAMAPVDAAPALGAPDMAANDVMDVDPLTPDHVEDDGMGMDMDDEFGDDFGGDEFGMDDDMGMDDGADVGAVTSSPAFTLIDDALTSIQTNLPDVKISEYKTLIQRLEDLQVQLQQIGKSYLGD